MCSIFAIITVSSHVRTYARTCMGTIIIGYVYIDGLLSMLHVGAPDSETICYIYMQIPSFLGYIVTLDISHELLDLTGKKNSGNAEYPRDLNAHTYMTCTGVRKFACMQNPPGPAECRMR